MRVVGRLDFAILGPLEVSCGGQPLPVGGSRERALLGMLLLEADGVVPMARLVGAVWDGDPPDGAAKAVRNCVSSLRRRFAEAGAPAGLIATESVGYRLRLAGCGFDVHEFGRLIAGARRLAAEGQAGAAVAQLRAALGLWRGHALAELGGTLLGAAAARLDEQRMTALEECLDLELTLGRHRRVAPELRVYVAEWPLRERLAGQLMLALYRSGRQAEALDAFHRLAKRLADDLGLDPSSEIARLHEGILRHDPALDPPGAGEIGEASGDAGREIARGGGSGQGQGSHAVDTRGSRRQRPVPAQLPLDVPGFTGRIAELTRLRGMLPQCRTQLCGEMVVISAIGGTAGMGKTALAVHFAHQIADRFPDGQLYINLRGFDPCGSPVAPATALRGFLGALGMPDEAIPPDTDHQSALYRTLLAGKRMLILLDNALDAGQVRPLLPAGPGCVAIVTSRSELTGLAATEGGHLLTLDVLTSYEAAELLASRLGQDRLNAEAGAASELAALCAGLPLALAIVAARAAARPGLALADLAAELRHADSRLDALDTGDPATDLRAVFSWSYRQLSEPAARMFRLLGLHPGPDATAPAAASLADVPIPQARVTLRELTRVHLLTEHEPGRYAFHDLLGAYAAELAGEPAAGDDPRAAKTRLFDYYAAVAAAAMDLLYPAEAHRRPRLPPAAVSDPALSSPQAALSWLNIERPALAAVVAHAAGGWPHHAMHLAMILDRYLQGGHYGDGLAIQNHARDAARRIGDDNGEAHALCAVSVMQMRLGQCAQAAETLEQALDLYRRAGNRLGQARSLTNLGLSECRLGSYTAGVRHYEQALALFRQARDVTGEVITLNNLGHVLQRLGRHQEAVGHLQRALTLARHDGDRDGEAYVLSSLGDAYQRSGQLKRAEANCRKAIALFREFGNVAGQADAMTNLGTTLTGLGQPERAREHHRQAMALFRASGDRDGRAVALNGLGEAARAAGDHRDAVSHHADALSLALDTGNREQQARAHAGLGRAYDALGQLARARERFQEALDLYTGLGYPEAGPIRDHLTAGLAYQPTPPASTTG